MEEIHKLEYMLMTAVNEDINEAGNNIPNIEDIQNGKFLNLLNSPKCEEICCQYIDNSSCDSFNTLLHNSITTYIVKKFKTHQELLELLCIGVASLHAFIQSNWTGPRLEMDSDSRTLVMPWFISIYEKSNLKNKEFKDEIMNCLVLDGESCCSVMSHPELLLLARVTLQICCDKAEILPSSQWWFLRCLFVHQQVLEEFSPMLHDNITTLLEDLKKCEPLMTKENLQISFYLETAEIHLYYRHITKSNEQVKMIRKLINMEVELMGALGKRTRFQEKELAQLTLKISLSEGDRSQNSSTFNSEHFPKDLKLDDETRLNKIKFSNDADSEYPELFPLEQAYILQVFVLSQLSKPKDDLVNEELLPYLTCLLSKPLPWSLQMSTLFQRCRLEGNHSRTIERAMMQTEELVHCFSKDKPDIKSRQQYIFCSHLPPHWKIEVELAKLLISLGVVKSALDIYLRLELWEDVIVCYNMLQLRHKAAEIIKQELDKKETVKLWCLLGDATDDPSCYEKAWELSNHKSGRAQRHWALYYFNKKQYAESIPHLRESLSLNSLQLTMWFRLGYAALVEENWPLCASAYQRYCSLDPESFEAWNNLSKAYVKMNQKYRAWITLQEAIKWNFENWRVWDNYMVVSTDVGKFDEVIQAYNRILDLRDKHLDLEVLDILIKNITIPDGSLDLKKKTEVLLMRLTQKVRNDIRLWKLVVKLMLHNIENESFEAAEKSISHLYKLFWSSIQTSQFESDIKECLSVIDISTDIVDAVLNFQKERSGNTAKLLASSKLCMQGLISRIKKYHSSDLMGESPEELQLMTALQDFQKKLELVITELQSLRSDV